MKKRNIIILIALLCCTTISANKWRVNNSPSASADFNDLEAALQSELVLPGDTLYVEGSPVIYKINDIVKKVTLIGPGYFLTENAGTQENKADAKIKHSSSSSLYLLAEGIVCEGLTFDNLQLYIGADNVTIKKCRTIGSGSVGNIYWGDKTSGRKAITNTIITQCFVSSDIQGNSYFESSTQDYSDGAIISNNIVNEGISYLYNAVVEYNTCLGGHFSYGSIYYTNGNGSIRHNVLYMELDASQNGTMTIANNYKFESTDFASNIISSDGKYQLTATSGLMDKAPNGSEVGAFGGTSPYVLSGLSNVPHIYEISAPASASAESGLDVTIKIATGK